MQNFEELGAELARRGKTESIKRLAESEDGRALSRMIDSDAVEKAARSGDTAALRDLITKVLSTGEGQRLAESVKKMMQD